MDEGGVEECCEKQWDSITFTSTVTPVNDEPSFTAGSVQVVLGDSGAATVTAWAAAITAGNAAESGQVLSFTVTNNTKSLFSSQPAVDSSGNGLVADATTLTANGKWTITESPEMWVRVALTGSTTPALTVEVFKNA